MLTGNREEPNKSTSLAKPESCETVKDIRYLDGYHEADKAYQLLCEEDGKMVLYTRPYKSEEWASINVKE